MDMLDGPAAERGGAAGGVDERHHDAEQDEEHENARVPAVGNGADEAVGDHGVEGVDEIEAAHEQRADHNADEQRRIGLLGDEGEDDRHDGRYQGPESSSHTVFLQTKKIMDKAEPVHDRLCAGFPVGLTALRGCDSTQDIFPRPRHTGPEKPIPFGGVPFHSAAISVAQCGSY